MMRDSWPSSSRRAALQKFRFADHLDRIAEGFHAPFLTGDGEEVAEQTQVDDESLGTDAFGLFNLDGPGDVLSTNARHGPAGHRQRLPPADETRFAVPFLLRRDFDEIAVQGFGQRRAFGFRTRDEYAARDLGFDLPHPGLSLCLAGKGAGLPRIPAPADFGLPDPLAVRPLARDEGRHVAPLEIRLSQEWGAMMARSFYKLLIYWWAVQDSTLRTTG